MKKISLALFCFLLTFYVSAQTPLAKDSTITAVVKMDTTAMQEYAGKYKMKDAPFEHVIITVKEGKLWGEAEGQGSAELAPTKDLDVFEVVGYGGSVLFVRNEAKKVKGCQLTIQGNTLEGEKQLF